MQIERSDSKITDLKSDAPPEPARLSLIERAGISAAMLSVASFGFAKPSYASSLVVNTPVVASHVDDAKDTLVSPNHARSQLANLRSGQVTQKRFNHLEKCLATISATTAQAYIGSYVGKHIEAWTKEHVRKNKKFCLIIPAGSNPIYKELMKCGADLKRESKSFASANSKWAVSEELLRDPSTAVTLVGTVINAKGTEFLSVYSVVPNGKRKSHVVQIEPYCGFGGTLPPLTDPAIDRVESIPVEILEREELNPKEQLFFGIQGKLGELGPYLKAALELDPKIIGKYNLDPAGLTDKDHLRLRSVVASVLTNATDGSHRSPVIATEILDSALLKKLAKQCGNFDGNKIDAAKAAWKSTKSKIKDAIDDSKEIAIGVTYSSGEGFPISIGVSHGDFQLTVSTDFSRVIADLSVYKISIRNLLRPAPLPPPEVADLHIEDPWFKFPNPILTKSPSTDRSAQATVPRNPTPLEEESFISGESSIEHQFELVEDRILGIIETLPANDRACDVNALLSAQSLLETSRVVPDPEFRDWLVSKAEDLTNSALQGKGTLIDGKACSGSDAARLVGDRIRTTFSTATPEQQVVVSSLLASSARDAEFFDVSGNGYALNFVSKKSGGKTEEFELSMTDGNIFVQAYELNPERTAADLGIKAGLKQNIPSGSIINLGLQGAITNEVGAVNLTRMLVQQDGSALVSKIDTAIASDKPHFRIDTNGISAGLSFFSPTLTESLGILSQPFWNGEALVQQQSSLSVGVGGEIGFKITPGSMAGKGFFKLEGASGEVPLDLHGIPLDQWDFFRQPALK